MAQKESTFLNMVLTLLIVSLVSAAILGYVHELTKDAILGAKTKAQEEAIVKVLPKFDSLGKSYKTLAEEGGDSLEIFPAYDSSKNLVGAAVKTYSKKGFGGNIDLMVGFAADGTVTGYSVLEHKETPGLGSKMEFWFNNADKPGQNIIGKNPGTTKFVVRKDGGDVDAITASTITSRAFLDAVVRAYNAQTKSVEVSSGATAAAHSEKETKEGGAR